MASDDAAVEAQEEQAQQEQGGKKPPGTWTPMETLHLIDAYQSKWYALKRGQLRTCDWDEVAESLAGRCAGHPEATDKSSVQCRHKVEKLRRKYRAERQLFLRKAPGHASSPWPFFERMDLMERGPVAAAEAAAAAKAALPFPDLKFGNARELQDHDSAMSLDEDPEDSNQPPPTVFSNRKRRHHHHNPHQDNLHEDNDGSYSPFTRKHSLYEMPSTAASSKRDNHKNLKFLDKMGGAGPRRTAEPAPFVEVASVIRSLGEGFLRMEQMKLQVQRETERFRAEMEMRRTEMVIDSQKQIADLFAKALVSSKRNQSPAN